MEILKFSYNVPDGSISRIIDGVCYANNYQDEISGSETTGLMIPNPETKPQYAKQMVRRYIIGCIKQYEAQLAADIARSDAIDQIDENLTLE